MEMSPTRRKLLAIMERRKKEREAKAAAPSLNTVSETPPSEKKEVTEVIERELKPAAYQPTDKYGNPITYNEKQQEFINLSTKGENCILLGPAGTGKTTCMQGTVAELINSGRAGIIQDSDGHKFLPSGTPGVVVISYTRRAVNNIKKVLPADLRNNCMTAHKLLEYGPVKYQVEDEETGALKNTMRFEPGRTNENPLPAGINTIIIEEASMMAVELYEEVMNALSQEVQVILLGDIQQLPPVFGDAILGHKFIEWHTVELTEVYRQALESPIIRLAHRILSGKSVPKDEFDDWHTKGQLTLHPWKKKLTSDDATRTLAAFFKRAYDSGAYQPEEDAILIPYNKACGTEEINRHIANHIARKEGNITYEVIAGFNKHYFSIGDRVLYEKEDAVITNITPHLGYTGASPQPESEHLDYWGYNPQAQKIEERNYSDEEVDFILDAMAESSDIEERVRKASHTLHLRLEDSGEIVSVDTASEINNMVLSYALTVHKSQGSEWRKVFVCFHHTHARMLQRELLYTAVTRAKEELYVICEPDSLVKGITSQSIKGDTLEEKMEYFRKKLDAREGEKL